MDGDDDAPSVPGKFNPHTSIGLVRSLSRERAWGARTPDSGDRSGIKIFLTELQQANIYAALNRALVHIARCGVMECSVV